MNSRTKRTIIVLLFLSIASTIVLPVFGIEMEYDGFESGNLDDWTQVIPENTYAQIVTSPVNNQFYAAEIYNNASPNGIATIYKNIPVEHRELDILYFRVFFRFTKLPPDDQWLMSMLEIQCSSPYFNTLLEITSVAGTPDFKIYARPSTYDLDEPITPEINTWYNAEFMISKANYTERVYLNGILQKTINISVGNQFTQFNNYRLTARTTWAAADISVYWDDFAYDDSFIGDYLEIPITAQEDISENLELAATLMAGLWIVIFFTHIIMVIQTGKSEYFIQLMISYTVAIIILLVFAAAVLTI